MRVAVAVLVAASLSSPAAAQVPDYSRAVATVLMFTTTDCPISNRYFPEIKRLAVKFASQGVSFSLVYPVPADTPALIQKHRARFGDEIPAIRDTKQQLVKATGVTVTPEVAVYDRQGVMVYRGRIDDRYIDFGKDRPEPTTHELEDALNAVVAGKPVAVKETRAVGCILSDLLK